MGTILKRENNNNSHLNIFELLGSDEVATTKAFAYLIARSPKILFLLLRSLGVNLKHSPSTFKKLSIEIERTRNEGRTDIEIFLANSFHVIIEAKIKKNKLKTQRSQYLKSFKKNKSPKNIMCFITSERISFEQNKKIETVYLTWRETLLIVEESLKKHISKDEKTLAEDFITFYRRGINMKEQKEVLVQDLSDKKEIDLFKTFNIYRRDETYGVPLYFAPHFSKNAKQTEGVGISYLSGVLGVLTIAPSEIKDYEDDLKKFAGTKKKLVKKWTDGINQLSKKITKRSTKVKTPKVMTFYFLDTPVKFKKPLQKDGGIKKGRGKGWIAASIPKNRCVSFSRFCEKIVQASSTKEKK